MLSPSAISSLARWLEARLGVGGLLEMLPSRHPVSMWLPGPSDGWRTVEVAIRVMAEGGHLPLLVATAMAARMVGDPPDRDGLPRDVELELIQALRELDAEAVAAARSDRASAGFDCLLIYAHEDAAQAAAICGALRGAGLAVFRDVDDIRPGSGIAASLAAVAERIPAMIALVSRASRESLWVQRELSHATLRRAAGSTRIFPVVIEDVPIPEGIRDVCAIDLREIETGIDPAHIAARLAPLVQAIRKGTIP